MVDIDTGTIPAKFCFRLLGTLTATGHWQCSFNPLWKSHILYYPTMCPLASSSCVDFVKLVIFITFIDATGHISTYHADRAHVSEHQHHWQRRRRCGRVRFFASGLRFVKILELRRICVSIDACLAVEFVRTRSAAPTGRGRSKAASRDAALSDSAC